MTSYAAGICYLVFVLLAIASPFLPLRFIGPTVVFAAISVAGGRLLEGPVPLSNQGFGYLFGLAIFQGFVTVVAAGVSLRFAIALATDRLRWPLSPKHKAQLHAFHRVVVVAASVVAGLVLTMGLTELLAGTSGGWYLDLGITLLSAGLAVAAIQRFSISHSAPVAALCLTLAGISAFGSGQSERIIRQAEAFAKGRPWCLVGPGGTPPITSIKQLGFFSLPKGRGYPHLALRVESGKERDEAHWSIRRQRMERGWGTGVPFCQVRDDYGTALRNGQLEFEGSSAFRGGS